MTSELERLKSEIFSADGKFSAAVSRYLLDHSGTKAEADQAIVEIAETATGYSALLDRLIQQLRGVEIDGKFVTAGAIETAVAKANNKKKALERLAMKRPTG